MKKDILLKNFSSFEISNEEQTNLIGGRKSASSAVVIGSTEYNGQTTMDIAYVNDGEITTVMCDQADSDWGGLQPIGSEVG